MRLGIFSDIHTEVFSDGGWPEFFKRLDYSRWDVLVLAGDILNAKNLHQLLLVFARICSKIEVVYVPGNHEFWGIPDRHPEKTWEEVLYPAEDRLGGRLHVLRTGRVINIAGQRFVGDTMWFSDTPDAQKLMSGWPEARFIPGYRKWVFEQNAKWRKFARSEILATDVVVTHHSPSYLSMPPRFRGADSNCFYIDGMMESVIMKRRPKLWVHGHTHDKFDYVLGETRVVCNARGIPTQPSFGCNEELVVEV